MLLALLMCASLLASCSSSKDEEETQKSPQGQVVDDPEINAVNDYVSTLAAENKFTGQTFASVGGGQQAEFEEETGNIENDALYKRQRELEERFGISWLSATAEEDVNSTTNHAVVDSVKRSVMAGTKDYDLVSGTLLVVGQPLFNGQCLEDVSSFSALDLSQDWWPATLPETHSLAGKLYFLNGPIVTNYYYDGMGVLFNKDVTADFGIEDPYALVSEGKWTFDKMVEIASAVPFNTDGSGVYRFANPTGINFLYAFDYNVTQFDDAGVPYVELTLPQRLSDIADKVSVIMGDDSQSAHHKFMTLQETPLDKYGKEYTDMFIDGEILFLFESTGAAASLRDKEVEFGILPMPKADAEQKDYISPATSWGSMFCYVPVCTRDIAASDVIVEAMAALSLKHLKPAFYDKILKGRSTHDADSRAMIDIIFKTKIYDIIDIYSLGSVNIEGMFVRSLNKAVGYDTSTLSSDYLIYSKMANNQIKLIMKMIDKK